MTVLDTTVVSELVLTGISIAEFGYGIARLPPGCRRESLALAAERITVGFDVEGFSASAARGYAAIVVSRERRGRPISAFDAQVAAICRVNRASLATRDTSDFSDVGIDLVDPWVEGRS